MQRKEVDADLEARQQEWSKKKWVWVPDANAGCLQAHIIKEAGSNITVKLNDGNERTLNKDDVDAMNPPKFDKCEDMATLTHLNESSVLHNLTDRYHSNLIYTYSGLFLVVINPWRRLPLYTDEMVAMYRGKKRRDLAPHIFAVCDQAYRDMLENKENQSLLITGESGAGKTENTKKVIQYLASVAGASPGTGMEAGQLEKQIVKTNPLLESFGNAKTIRNNNSSRFGKFIRIEFGSDGKIVGCNIDNYLLEKSRVVRHAQNERSFHIFYQLVEGASAEQKKDHLIEEFRNYKYLQGGTSIDGVDNAKEFQDTIDAMAIIGFTEEEKNQIWSIVSGTMQFGNLNFASGRRDDNASLKDPQVADKVAHLFGIKSDEFQKSMLKPRVKVGREYVTVMVTAEKAYHSADALSKSIYERLFKWIVAKINSALEVTVAAQTFIGCLDIAGFEIFEQNSFEQLCINLTNEKLQQFFNHHMFILEQEEYLREGVEWKFIDFGLDLQPTIDLIEKQMGIMSILDEECLFPKATDKSFCEKLHATHAEKNDKFGVIRMHPEMFTLTHYAGTVEYGTADWLEKNKDPINDNVAVQLSKSRHPLVCELFNDVVAPEDQGHGRKKGSQFITVSQRHRQQLTSLMTTLKNTTPHFVRCIIPNEQKKPGIIDPPLVLDQLRCNGVLEGIRIVRMGYPNRIPFAEFKQRYEILAIGVLTKGFMDGRIASQKLVEALKIKPEDYKIGLSKVFFKAGILGVLEEERDAKLGSLITGFQAVARGYLARSAFRRQHGKDDAIKLIQRNARVFVSLYNWPWWKLYRQVKPLLSIHRQEQDERALHDKIKDLEAKLEEAVKSREALEHDKSSLVKERDQLEEELDAEKEALDETVAALKRTEETRKELASLTAELEEQLDEAEKAALELEKEKKKLKSKLDDVTAQLSDDSEKLAAIEETKKAKDSEFEEMQKQFAKEKADLQAELNSEKTRLEEQLSEVRQDLTSSKAAQDRLKKQSKTLTEEKDELSANLTTAESAKAKAEKNARRAAEDLSAAQNEVATLNSKLSSADDMKGDLERELTSLKSRVDDLAQAKSALEVQKNNMEEELDEISKDLTEATAAKSKSEAANKELQLELEEMTDKKEEQEDNAKELEIKVKSAERELAELADKLAKAREDSDNSLLAALKEERRRNSELETKLQFEVSRRKEAEDRLANEKSKARDLDFKLKDIREIIRNQKS
eukprot:Lithocolla_globosa_v1_NODE_497_length_3887_cov_213.445459.p1 type:complete len:1220 gc:universal NODE_497_length_3887_cov_213.445459:3837-178(-)